MTPSQSKLNPLTLLVAAVVGVGVGLFLQTYRSGVGFAPFAPPLSLPASLLVISVILLILAHRMKKNIADERTETVNPFHAVRLLAAARAAQYTGSVFTGFGVGLFLTVAGRVGQIATGVWLPMLLTTVLGVLLLIAGIIAERACRIPPDDSEAVENEVGEEGTEPGSVTAYRAHEE